MSKDSKILKFLISFFIIIIGISIFTALLSIRSWYKPSIKLGEVSPVTQIVKKDVEVKDQIATQQARRNAKRNAIQNIKQKRILEVNEKMTQKSFDNLKFVVKVARDSSSIQKIPAFPVNNKISLQVQNGILNLSNEEFEEFKVLTETNIPESISQNLDLEKYRIYLEELNRIQGIEKKYFLEELSKIKTEINRKKKEKEALGKQFFENLAKVDSETLFMKAFSIQKKLLDLGLVNGIPRSKINDNIRILYPELNLTERQLVEKLIERTTLPNINIDWRAVSEIEKEAMSKVEDVIVTLKAGTILAKKGERLDEKNFYYMKELNMLRPQPDWQQVLRNLIMVSLTILIMTLALIIFKVKRWSISVIIILFLVPIGTFALISLIAVWGVNKLAMAPLAIIPILLTSFYMRGMAAAITVLASAFLTYSLDMNIWQVLPLFAGSMYAIMLVRRAHQREDLTNAGTKIAICQVLVFALTVLLAVGNFSVTTVLTIALLYGLSGLISGVVSVAALPYLESSLRLLTPFKLAELSNPNQPLLKKLKEKAPGTYQHSLSVSRFAEEAANAIGANAELLRVGLLYHDIGKTYKPDYFIENQFGAPNPHTTLDDPKKSAEIIIKHVPEGVKIAKQYNLPQAIIDFIPMHQGETITNYFYLNAMERYGKEAVNAEDYRYPGPSPNSKETGIAMMADSIEASLKSVKDLDNEADAAKIISKIIDARLKEGELANANLNPDELDKIKLAFVSHWRSQNHERVQYPEENKAK